MTPNPMVPPALPLLRLLILGTGAMAKRFGAQLARAGQAQVTLAGSWPEALRAIAREGITVEEADAVWRVSVEVSDRAALPAAAFDLVLVLVKSHQTEAVAPLAARALAPGGIILSLQNGIGNREILSAAAPGRRVRAGVTSAGATGLGPSRVRLGGPGLTVLGEMGGDGADGADTEPRTTATTETNGDRARNPDPNPRPLRLRDLARRFESAGLKTECSTELDRLLWRKLAVNCAINPLTALHGIPNGRLLEDPALHAQMEAAAREVQAVAEAKGIDLGLDAAVLAEEVARKTAGNRSSMLQDMDRGARTEIDAIAGAVVREGQRLDVPTPVNASLWEAVLLASAAAEVAA
jgi:2-dehydropantoate 2-reductase